MPTSQYGLSEKELLTELSQQASKWRKAASIYTSLQKRLRPLRQSLGDIDIMLGILDKISPLMTGTILQQLRNNQSTWDAQRKSLRQDLDSFFLEHSKSIPNINLDSRNWTSTLDEDYKIAKTRAKKFTEGFKAYQRNFQVMAQHKQAIEQQQLLLGQNPGTKELANVLSAYHSASLNETLQKFYDDAEFLVLSDGWYENRTLDEATIFEKVAQTIFHRKPTMAVRAHQLRAQIQDFCKQVEKILVEKLKKTIANVTYKTQPERQKRLLELLNAGEKHIEGSCMDFTFTDTALEEFNSKSDIYKELAAASLNLGLSEHLPNGSLTVVSGHAYVDKNRDDGLRKIRSHSGISGDDNLPRIIVKNLPYGPNKKERFCITAFLSKKEQEAANNAVKVALANRDVEEWPENANDVVQLNPVSIPLSAEERTQIQNILTQFEQLQKQSDAPSSEEDTKKGTPQNPPVPAPVPPTLSGTKHPRAPKPKISKPGICQFVTLDHMKDQTDKTSPSEAHLKTTKSATNSVKAQAESIDNRPIAQRSVGIEDLVCLLQMTRYVELIHERASAIRQQRLKREKQRILSEQLADQRQSVFPRTNQRQ